MKPLLSLLYLGGTVTASVGCALGVYAGNWTTAAWAGIAASWALSLFLKEIA